MLEIFLEEIVTETLAAHLGVLHKRYIGDLVPEIVRDFMRDFDQLYDTHYVILGTDGKPVSRYAVLDTLNAAGEFRRIIGQDASIGLLLIER